MSVPALKLSASNIHIWRGERHLLRGVDFEIGAGELLHVRGHNGAGKTTLLRIVAGLMHPEEGEVRWCSRLLRDADDYHGGMIYAAHETALKADLTAIENLRYVVGLKRSVGREDLRAALAATDALECADLPLRVLSAGQRRRVAMARVLAVQARLWLLDEPASNLDTAGSQLIADLLDAHVGGGGMAVVVAHHDLGVKSPLQVLDLAA
jgi:heme exporter protein A